MSISLNSAGSSDTASLTSRRTFNSGGAKKWALAIFDERIYEIVNLVHPGLPIEYDAVEHIRAFLQNIVCEIVEQKATTVVEVDRITRKLFGFGLQSVVKDAWDSMQIQSQKHKFQKLSSAAKKAIENQHKLAGYIKETLGPREKEKRDREKREIEKIACYIYFACENVTEDIIRLTGNYVKNIPNCDPKITLTNMDVALNADRALMELRIKLKNEEEAESPGGFGFLAEFDEFVADETESKNSKSASTKKLTYESVAVEFLRDERRFIRELNRINVFRRRIESIAIDEDRVYIQQLFGNLPDIHELALKIERTLEDAIELSDTQCIGLGIWDLAEAYEFDAYITYIVRETDDEETILLTDVVNKTIRELLNNERCARLFESEDHLFNSSLDGQSFKLAVQYVLPQLLHIPLFHIFQYVEYINKLSRLSSNDEDRIDLNNCRSALTGVRTNIDTVCSEHPETKLLISSFLDQLTKSEKIYNVKRLHDIQSSIDGFTGSPIGKTCNEVEKEGCVGMVRPSLMYGPNESVTKNKKWKTERYIYMFDQLILFCKKNKNGLKFKDRVAVHSIDVFDVPDAEGIPFSFRIVSRDKTCLPKSFQIVCKNADDKKQWMEVLVRVTTKNVLDRILDNFEKDEAKRIPLIIPGPEQYRFAEPDNEENISFEDYTSSSGIPVIKNGTVIKLIERLTYHSYTDSKYIQTFLISYRSFCTPNDLLSMLLERFNIPVPNKLQHNLNKGGGPLAGRYDTVQSHGLSTTLAYSPLFEQSFQRFRKEYERPVQLRVLSVINQWVKFHWYDFQCDLMLLEALERFLQKCCDPKEKLTKQHKKFCKTILATIEKRMKNGNEERNVNVQAEHEEGHVNSAFVYGEEHQPPAYANDETRGNAEHFKPQPPMTLWHSALKGDIDNYDLLTLHPLEIGRQLTLLHFDLYRAIQPIELVEAAWTKHDKYRKSPQLLRLTDHSTLLTYWVSKSIVETESLEERVAMFNRALEVMSVFEELHNFTGLVAFLAALQSSCVFRLSWCWDRLDNEKQKCYSRFVTLCEPRWTEMQKRLQTINPPCVPFFGHYLSNIFFFEQGNSTFVKSPHGGGGGKKENVKITEFSDSNNKRVLVSFLKCRRISNLIREIQMYQNEPYSLSLEPSIRQFFESINPKSDYRNEEALENYLYQKSLEIQPKGVDPPTNDAKPKHTSTTLRSPGIKPPKVGNHYSPSHVHHHHHHQSSTVPSTPVLFHDTKRSLSHAPTEENQFERRTLQKIAPLQPPPLLPRSRAAPPSNLNSLPPTTIAPMVPTPKSCGFVSSPTSAPSSSSASSSSATMMMPPPPKLHPRRAVAAAAAKSPMIKSPLTDHNSAFQFPDCAAPPIPPRPSTSSSSPSDSPNYKENTNNTTETIFARDDSPSSSLTTTTTTTTATDSARSPTVRLSVPLPPPALPPPRGTASVYNKAPPPLPPKACRSSSNTTTPSTSPTTKPTSPQPPPPSLNFLPPTGTTPPPLPPKTYKRSNM